MNTQNLPNNVLVSLENLLELRFLASNMFHKTYKRSAAALSGNYASAFRGRGIDFSEVRLYEPGDDIRNMDWRVTARTTKPHVKLFTEERERPVLFVVDCGTSMQFGTRTAFKSVIAARISALLAWSAMSHGDRIGGVLFAGDSHEEIKPAGAKRGILKFLKRLVEWNVANFQSRQPNESSQLINVVARLKRVARPGSLVYFISDFSHLDKKSEQHLAQIARHCDVVMINVIDHIEKFPPPPGNYMMTDGFSFGKLSMDNSDMREVFRQEFIQREENLKTFAKKHRIHYFSVATSDDIHKVLRDQLTHKILKTL